MIAFEHVTKRFGAKTVLDDVSFEVKDGEIVFIIGKSGMGKSVTLKHIVGLLEPDAGVVRVDEFRVTSLSERELAEVRKRCGMVFQFPALLDSLTVYENMAFGLRAHGLATSPEDERRRVREALALVHVRDACLAHLPTEISFGIQKRIAIARAVALEPRHLLFDEPTTGLDPVATNAINFLIRDLAKRLNVTAIVVSHDMHCAVAIADRILMLDQGKLVAQGSPRALVESSHPVAREFMREARERMEGAT